MEKRISGTTSLYGLIGSPVGHSGSPAMYNAGFERMGIDAAYLAFDIKESQVRKFFEAAKLLNIKGFNVTMPCKMEVTRLVDEMAPVARLSGAANTVVNENGRWVGYNTDGVGFAMDLKDYGVSAADKCVTLLGGGGAATAILIQLGILKSKKVKVFNRKGENFTRLEILAVGVNTLNPDIEIEICDLMDKEALYQSIRESDILVNATNVGMAPKEGKTLINDTSVFRKDLVVVDIIYHPLETKLMKDAKEAGVETIIGGKGMLFWQGVEAFRLFTGKQMPIEEIKKLVFEDE